MLMRLLRSGTKGRVSRVPISGCGMGNSSRSSWEAEGNPLGNVTIAHFVDAIKVTVVHNINTDSRHQII